MHSDCVRARASGCLITLSACGQITFLQATFFGSANRMQSAPGTAGGHILCACPRHQVWKFCADSWQARHSQHTSRCSVRAQNGRVCLHETLDSVQIDFLGEPTTGNLNELVQQGAGWACVLIHSRCCADRLPGRADHGQPAPGAARGREGRQRRARAGPAAHRRRV